MTQSSSSDQKTTTQNLTPEQQSLVSAAQPGYQQFAAGNQTLPTGDQAVAPFDPNQVAGQQSVVGSTDAMGNITGSAGGANEFLTSGAALDPSTNPGLAAYQKSAVAPIYQNLSQTTLPQLGANASTGSGGISANVGGSREGIAQGIATEGANNAAGATEANIANAGYGAGLNAMVQGVGQAPMTAAAQALPGATQEAVGSQQQQQQQAVLDANNAAAQFAQFLPLLKAQFLTQGAAATPGGSTTAVGQGTQTPSTLQDILGIGSAVGGLAGGAGKLLAGLAA